MRRLLTVFLAATVLMNTVLTVVLFWNIRLHGEYLAIEPNPWVLNAEVVLSSLSLLLLLPVLYRRVRREAGLI